MIPTELKTYTVFCQASSGQGTTWINTVEAHSPEEAQTQGVEQCRMAWHDGDPESEAISCYCVIEGSVKIAIFEELTSD